MYIIGNKKNLTSKKCLENMEVFKNQGLACRSLKLYKNKGYRDYIVINVDSLYVIFNGSHYFHSEKDKYNYTKFVQQAKLYYSFKDANDELNKFEEILRGEKWKVIQIRNVENAQTSVIVKSPKYENDINDDKTNESLKKYKEQLEDSLYLLNQKQEDLLHYCEIYEVNEREAFEFYKKLQSVRNERRMIKNKIRNINELLGVNEVPNKYYTSRIYHKMFSDKEKEKNE